MTRPRYEAYRDSGVEWIGDVPAHWVNGRISALFTFRSGGTPSTADADYWEGEIPWVSAKDMKALTVVDTEDHISERAVVESATSLVPSGSVLMVTRSGILKHTLPVAVALRDVTINQDVKAFVPGQSPIHAKYFVYWAHGIQDTLLTLWRQQGATVESLDFDAVRSTPCPLPPLDEQQAIAAFLDREIARIDALVEKKRLLIERLEEQRTALISRTVTRGLPAEAARAAGLDPSPRLKPSGVEWLGDVPEHWRLAAFRRVLREPLKYGANESAELDDPSLPRFIRITDIDTAGHLRDETFRSLPADVAEPYLLEQGDLLFARSGSVGRTFLYDESWGTCAYAGYLVRARVDTNQAIPRFISYFTASQSYLSWLRTVAIQATIENVNAEKYAKMPLPLPPLDEQRAIAAFLDRETARIDRMVELVTDAAERLQEYRTALITATVSGKIDVRQSEPVATTGG